MDVQSVSQDSVNTCTLLMVVLGNKYPHTIHSTVIHENLVLNINMTTQLFMLYEKHLYVIPVKYCRLIPLKGFCKLLDNISIKFKKILCN